MKENQLILYRKEVINMKYTFPCPADGFVTTVDAESDDEAVQKLMAAGKVHMADPAYLQGHQAAPPVADEEMAQMVRAGMKKEEVPPESTPPVMG